MYKLLFKPFDIGRWFVLGFSAWLAMLGRGKVNIPDISKLMDKRPLNASPELAPIGQKMMEFLQEPWLMGLIIGTVSLLFFFGILFCWLRSRGDFMFVHHLYQPTSSIKNCWQRAKQHANSLFQWRIIFFVIAATFLVAEGFLVWKQIIQPCMLAHWTWSPVLEIPLFVHIALFIVWLIAINVIIIFLKDFVVPIMYWQNCSASSAWTQVLALCNEHPFSVIGYLLAMMLWGFLAALAILLVLLCTCCTAFIPMVLPYISAVFLLPYYLFFRAYPIYFLCQWNPDLVPAPAEVAVEVVIDIHAPELPPMNV